MNIDSVARENRILWGILHNANTMVYDHYIGGKMFSRPTFVIEIRTEDITVKLNGIRELELDGEYLLAITYIDREFIVEIYTGYNKVDDSYDGGKYIGRVTEVLKWD